MIYAKHVICTGYLITGWENLFCFFSFFFSVVIVSLPFQNASKELQSSYCLMLAVLNCKTLSVARKESLCMVFIDL